MQQLSRPYAGIKDIDATGRTVQFYGSAFGNEDSDGDIIMPGAYTKTILENGPGTAQPRIKHLAQHDTYTIIGKFTELTEDSTGLLCTSVIANTAAGNDALALYELDLYEHSVGFQTMKSLLDNTDPENPIRRLTELKLWEVSSVTWGANANTPLVGMKGYDPTKPVNAQTALLTVDALNARMGKLFKALRTGNMQDSTYEHLQAEADSLQTAYKGLISLPSTPAKPTESRPLIIDSAEQQKADEPDVPKAKRWLEKAIALHAKHMDGTVEPTAASQKTMMTQMENALTALGGDMGAMKATLEAVEPSGKELAEAFIKNLSFLHA